MRSSVSYSFLALLIAGALAMAAGLAFRFTGALTEPLWLDEAYTAFAADRGLGFLWRVTPGYETHPPFYYTLMHLWGLVAGDALAVRRLPSLAAGVAIIALAGVAGARLGPGRRGAAWTAAVSAGLVALSPMAVEMARQMRPYTLMGAAYAAALLILLAIGRRRRAGRPAGAGAVAAVLACEALIAWLHNLGPLLAFAVGLALLVQMDPRGRRDWALWLGGHAAVVAAWLPALAILTDQAPIWVHSTWLTFSWAELDDQLGRLYATPAALFFAASLGAFGALLLWREDGRPREAAALAILALLPAALSIALSAAVAPVFLPRTLSPVIAPAFMLVARGSFAPGRGRWLGAALIAALAWSFIQQDIMFRARGPIQQWHLAVEWLARRHRPGDVIWAYPNEGALPFDYAARDRGLPFVARPIPMAVPAAGVGFYPTGSRGAVSLRPPEIARLMRDPAARAAPTLWLLRLGPAAYDVDDAMLRALETGGRRPVSVLAAGPISFIGLRRADLPLPDYLSGRGVPGGAAAAR